MLFYFCRNSICTAWAGGHLPAQKVGELIEKYNILLLDPKGKVVLLNLNF